MSAKPTPPPPSRTPAPAPARGLGHWLLKIVLWVFGLIGAGLMSIVLVAGLAMVVAYPNLPDISDLADYRPKLPLRVFTAEGVLMGEFGEERRNLTPIAEIPKVMKDAVLSIEDARFYQHGGVDYLGI
ncbi:MAG: transglycosylase domain-containing protein, partial [Limnohabitans sp.]